MHDLLLSGLFHCEKEQFFSDLKNPNKVECWCFVILQFSSTFTCRSHLICDWCPWNLLCTSLIRVSDATFAVSKCPSPRYGRSGWRSAILQYELYDYYLFILYLLIYLFYCPKIFHFGFCSESIFIFSWLLLWVISWVIIYYYGYM